MQPEQIRVTFYFASGNEQSSHDCADAQEAFDRLTRTGMTALARPVNTTCGCYSWNPAKDHTFEDFMAKLSLCCNDPAQYSRNLIDAGICASWIDRGQYAR